MPRNKRKMSHEDIFSVCRIYIFEKLKWTIDNSCTNMLKSEVTEIEVYFSQHRTQHFTGLVAMMAVVSWL